VAAFVNGGNTMNGHANSATRLRSTWRVILWGGLALLLLIPALAMQVTSEVDWSPSDFLIMGALLATLGLAIEAMMRLLRDWPARLAACTAAVILFLLIWAELAVGVFGTPLAGS
jgi:peptidoglycan/LPS O-acetylase OafA/YrhL